METLVEFHESDAVATIVMDDGKMNVLSLEMILQVNAVLDRAERRRGAVLLTGREGVFSAGFDLPTLRAGGTTAVVMVRAGFELAERLLSFPAPVVVACTGHAVAMGLFLLLSGDYRLGASGAYKLTANEVAMGLTMPRAAVEILRQRMTPAHFNRAVTLAETFSPDNAVAAGLLDRVVQPAELRQAGLDVAGQLSTLDPEAHAASKRRSRQQTLQAVRAAIEADYRDVLRHS